MNLQGFPANGNWYKGNLHSHTTVSDGKLTPEQVVRLFRDNGYSFLCLSEHDCYTDWRAQLGSPEFLLLPGLEASAVLRAGVSTVRKVHHIHAILGTKEMQRAAQTPLLRHLQRLEPPIHREQWDGAEVAQELNDCLRAHGCFTTYNHPVWSRVEQEEYTNLNGVWAVEIYNYNTVNESGTGYDTSGWDRMLRAGKRVFGFASDDNHNEGVFDDACGGWIMVCSRCLTHDAIVSALLRGDFYASSGPSVTRWEIVNGVAVVECSPVERVNFIAGGPVNAGRTVIAQAETMTRAEFPLRGDETYLRAECVEPGGKTAWTNPIFIGSDCT